MLTIDKVFIQILRQKVCYSQKKLADELEVSENTIRAWEHGIHQPNITQKGKILRFCNAHSINVEGGKWFI